MHAHALAFLTLVHFPIFLPCTPNSICRLGDKCENKEACGNWHVSDPVPGAPSAAPVRSHRSHRRFAATTATAMTAAPSEATGEHTLLM